VLARPATRWTRQPRLAARFVEALLIDSVTDKNFTVLKLM